MPRSLSKSATVSIGDQEVINLSPNRVQFFCRSLFSGTGSIVVDVLVVLLVSGSIPVDTAVHKATICLV